MSNILERETSRGTQGATAALRRLRAPLSRALRTPLAEALVRPLITPRKLDDYLELVDPCWSLEQVRARVVAVRREAPEVTSLYVQPNENWRGHRAGQHVTLAVEVDGVRRTRCFSLSQAPVPGAPLRMTIKAHDGGCVSRWANEAARVGDVVTLSQAQGSFVLPDVVPSQLLFISGGSGLTPLVAMAQQLVADGYRGQLTWLHFERDVVPLDQELHALVHALPAAQLFLRQTGDARVDGVSRPKPGPRHLDRALLESLVPDYRERELFLCGPQPLMHAARQAFDAAGLQARVHSEQFRLAPVTHVAGAQRASGGAGTLVFARSGRSSAAQLGLTLLEQAERAGLRPQYGCRMGICHTCKCTKLSGTVRNELTGQTSDACDEEIQLCIHTPQSDVSLDL